MHRKHPSRPTRALRTLAALTAAGSTIAASACSAPQNPARDCPATPLPPAPQALVVVVGVHANAPAPALPAAAAPTLQAALAAGSPVSVIGLDGSPAVIPTGTASIPTSTCDAFNAALAGLTNAVISTITTATADSDGNDLYAALALAADTVHSTARKGGAVLVIDSGLAERDTSPVNFAQPGMTRTDPAQVAEFAATNQPLDLSGLTVTFYGLGQTSPPQPALSPAEISTVTAIWTQIADRSGATHTEAVPSPRTGPAATTRHSTRVTPTDAGPTFTPPTASEPTETTFSNNDIHFDFDSAHIANAKAAAKALAPLARWLAEDPAHRVTLRGRTDSSGSNAYNKQLAGRRADSVKKLLLTIESGIRARQIDTVADGSAFAGAIPDTRPDGTLDPAAAAANRHVLAIARTS